MGLFGTMTCGSCGHWGPPLAVGEMMNAESDLRRCKRCQGLVAVLVRYRKPATGEWVEASGRARCRNDLPWPPEDRRGDGEPERCGSQALAALTPGEVSDPTAPCPVCRGLMQFESGGIAD